MDDVDDMLEVRASSAPDLESPNAARMYDYHLGGSANFAVDRAAVDEMLEGYPGGSHYARVNRAFLGRVVRYLVNEVGIDQFLDLGSGVPTVGNVHEIAQTQNPNARVAYVDVEPIAVRHARHLLERDGVANVTVTEDDIRSPESVLSAQGVAGLLDFDRPVGVLAVGILPFIPGDEASQLMTSYRDATVSGSYAAVSHVSRTSLTEEQIRQIMDIMQRTSTPEQERTPEQIRALLPGYSLLEPGVVPVPEWHPDPDSTPSEEDVHQSNCYGAVGYRP